MLPYPLNDLTHELSISLAKGIVDGEVKMDMLMDILEKKTILKVMELMGGKKSRVSRHLGISRVTLDYKLKDYLGDIGVK